MKELKLNLLETSFAPFPPKRDLRIHIVGQNQRIGQNSKSWSEFKDLVRIQRFGQNPNKEFVRIKRIGQNISRPGILSHDESSLLQSLLAGRVEFVPVLWLVKLNQDWPHGVVHWALLPTKEVLDNNGIRVASIFL